MEVNIYSECQVLFDCVESIPGTFYVSAGFSSAWSTSKAARSPAS
jgi:hypothetical protein